MDDQPCSTVMVAIDRDKSSQVAVKWAVDNLSNTNPSMVLAHVKIRTQDGLVDSGDADLNQFFLPFRGYCARKGIESKDVILEESDVSKALIEYINENRVTTTVVGAATRNNLIRILQGVGVQNPMPGCRDTNNMADWLASQGVIHKQFTDWLASNGMITKQYRSNSVRKKFKTIDVPTAMTKNAPEFCTVYVISKGKVMTVRSASRPLPNTAMPPKQPFPAGLPSEQSVQDDSVKTPFARGRGVPSGPRRSVDKGSNDFILRTTPPRERPKSVSNNLLTEEYDLMRTSRTSHSRDSISDDIDFSGSLRFGSCDISDQNLDFSMSSNDSPRSSCSSSSAQRDLESEMKRLKLELKQTMDMYSTACKEALSAKQKANELNKWKVEEARKFEEARQAEEAALAVAEREKAKCKVAIETAEAAQRLAELEAQKRRQAELKARRESAEKKRVLDVLAHNDVRYRKYTIDEIETATGKFSSSLKIGEGGYGPVFKASLDHTLVAIKVLRADATQGKKQFQQEVEVLSCIRHPHMVLLLGACPEYGCLVYEFMDNGSLEDRIFRRGDTPSIPWRLRFKIAAEVATALLFLHQTKPEPLVHRDLKPANILLDRNYVSKIADVGLSRLVPPSVADSVTQYHMTSAAGTFCYIDPEYQQTGMLGVKSDIYSLGIMLLQVVTAKPPMGLSHHVARAIDKGTFKDIVDPSVPDWPMDEALAFAKLALKCAELRRKDRPDLGSVVLPELYRLKNLGVDDSNCHNGFSYGPPSYITSNTASISRASQASGCWGKMQS